MNAGAALRLVAVMALWAACFPLITVGLDLAPHMAFAAMRATVAGVFLLVLGAVSRRPVPRDVRSWALVVVVGLGATTLGFLGMFHAAEFILPGLATVLSNTQPLLAAVLAYLFLGERLRVFGKIGMLTGFGGMAVIGWAGFSGGGIEGYTLGNAYVLLAAFGVAVGNVAISGLGGRVDPLMAMGFQLLVGALPLAGLSFLTEDLTTVDWSLQFVGVLLALAVPGTAVAFWLWFEVLEEVELNRANVFTFLVPVLALVAGALFFEERLGWTHAVGTVLILAGVGLVQRDASPPSGTQIRSADAPVTGPTGHGCGRRDMARRRS